MSQDRRTALVTGAARGIGAATVRALCAEGYGVLALDSCAGETPQRGAGVQYALASRRDLEELAAEHPDQILVEVADVRERTALAAAAARAVGHFGRLDAVVAAAAVILGGQPLWQTPQTHLQTLWDVDVMGVWNTAAVCVPYFLEGPAPSGCRFVAVASAAGTRGLFHLGGYGVAKHAVVGLVRALAADLAGTGVSAVAVSPGSTRTAMLEATAAIYGLDDVDHFTDAQLTGRLNDPQEVAALIAFCCSPHGGVANGAVMSAEGGFRG
ncbi:mycofactocin-coupled SDR family oxidoreductase [Streptomyces sp. 4N124]|uniref:mycofactocin-coupled SDR family oxidoreductase n=1 Tax=Streptomyces sp. 4N124 TaxID=3457420 RepID=UPI003FD27370